MWIIEKLWIIRKLGGKTPKIRENNLEKSKNITNQKVAGSWRCLAAEDGSRILGFCRQEVELFNGGGSESNIDPKSRKS